MPADLIQAIQHAALIVFWQENLAGDDMPPRWMWALEQDLNDHFNRVRAKNKSLYGTEDEDDESISVGSMRKNEYAENRGRNLR